MKQHAVQEIVCEGTPEADGRINFQGRVLTNDPMLGPGNLPPRRCGV